MTLTCQLSHGCFDLDRPSIYIRPQIRPCLEAVGRGEKHAPARDRTDRTQVADLTILQKESLVPLPAQDSDVSVQAMMEMRAVCQYRCKPPDNSLHAGIDWSASVPASHEDGESGGILAIANRSGKVGLWM